MGKAIDMDLVRIILSICLFSLVAQYGSAGTCKKPIQRRICVAQGDPHYTSFDNVNGTDTLNFQGICLYVMAETKPDSSLPYFRVMALNERRSRFGVSFPKEVIIDYQGQRWTLKKGNCTQESPSSGSANAHAFCTTPVAPHTHPCTQQIYGHLTQVWDAPELGVRVCFNGLLQAAIEIENDDFCGEVQGLCGDFNQDVENDKLVDYEPATDDEFGNSWKVTDDTSTPSGCPTGFRKRAVRDLPPPSPKQLRRAKKACSRKIPRKFRDKTLTRCMNSYKGIFTRQLNDCVFDIIYGGVKKPEYAAYACGFMSNIAADCSVLMNKRIKWRGTIKCPLRCLPPLIFSENAPACIPTCQDPNPKCSITGEQEACVCPKGKLLKGPDCVDPSDCDGVPTPPPTTPPPTTPPPGSCSNPCKKERNLVYKNRKFWGDSSSTSGIWQNALMNSPSGGMTTNAEKVDITFKPKNNLCFIPTKICMKGINSRKCRASVSCPGQGFGEGGVCDGCIEATCKKKSVTFSFWKDFNSDTMTLMVTKSNVMSD